MKPRIPATLFSPTTTDRRKPKWSIYCVDDGMLFQSFSINADSIPVDALQCFSEKPHIRINYCIKGKCDVEFNDHEKTYISGGDMTLNCGQKVRSLSFPENSYHGIEIYIFVYSNWANRTRDFESSKSTPELLYEKYKNDDSSRPYLNPRMRLTRSCRRLSNVFQTQDATGFCRSRSWSFCCF